MIIGILFLILIAILFPRFLRTIIILIFLAFTALPIIVALDDSKTTTQTNITTGAQRVK